MNRFYSNLFNVARRNARRRGIEFLLTREDLAILVDQAEGRCMITGVAFEFPDARGKRRPWVPSLDRIRSDQGYTLENCRLVCVAVNLAMNEWGVDALNRLLGAFASNGGGFKEVRDPVEYCTMRQMADERGVSLDQPQRLDIASHATHLAGLVLRSPRRRRGIKVLEYPKEQLLEAFNYVLDSELPAAYMEQR